MTVREAQESDVPRVVELNHHVQLLHTAEHPDVFRSHVDAEEVSKLFLDGLADPDRLLLVADLETETVGYLWAELQRQPGNVWGRPSTRFYVHQMAVDTGSRRRGVGRSLMQELERIAVSNSVSRIALDTWAFNEAARSFFAAVGFEDYSEDVEEGHRLTDT